MSAASVDTDKVADKVAENTTTTVQGDCRDAYRACMISGKSAGSILHFCKNSSYITRRPPNCDIGEKTLEKLKYEIQSENYTNILKMVNDNFYNLLHYI